MVAHSGGERTHTHTDKHTNWGGSGVLSRMGPVSIGVLAAACVCAAARPTIVPTDEMNITESTTFTPGTYTLPHGVNIVADGVTLDIGGANLIGSNFLGAGVTVRGRTGFNITTSGGGSISSYFYGVQLLDVSDFSVTNLNLSANWGNNGTPWLDINAPPDLNDRDNLGGGLFLLRGVGGTIEANIASFSENGFDIYDSTRIIVARNTNMHNAGWGVHLHNVTHSTITSNVLDHNIRTNDGDSAAILLVYGSHYNTVVNNSCRYSGDGFFIGNEAGCPSNFNEVVGNDCSHASANAFEATFSNGNVFRNNRASSSRYGFWLGYSYNSTVEGNTLLGNAWGIAIDHGQFNKLSGNSITNTNGPGIMLTSDGSNKFPQPCLALPNQTVSSTTEIYSNIFVENNNFHLMMQNTTDSLVYNNYFGPALRPGTISADMLSTASSRFQYSDAPTALSWPNQNIVGGSLLGGNWYVDYVGRDSTGDGIGDTNLPYVGAGGSIAGGKGDRLPLKIPNSP